MSVPKRREQAPERGPIPVEDLVPAVLEDIGLRAMGCGNLAGIPTGFSRFDKCTGGLQPETLTVLGGLPGVGKTAFALNIAGHATLRGGVPTLMSSLQLSTAEATECLLAAESGLDADRLRKELIEYSDWKSKIYPLEAKLKAAPLVLADSGAATLRGLRKRLHAFRHDKNRFRKEATDQRALLVVDSLPQVCPKGRGEPSERKIAKVICELKALAKEYQVAVLATSDLNGNAYLREDRQPRLSDLRWSGTIEGHADTVLFLHRHGNEYDGQEDDDCATDLIIAKHRSASTAVLPFIFKPETLRFEEQA